MSPTLSLRFFSGKKKDDASRRRNSVVMIEPPTPPTAPKNAVSLLLPDGLEDEYTWMKDQDPKIQEIMRKYMHSEKIYARKVLRSLSVPSYSLQLSPKPGDYNNQTKASGGTGGRAGRRSETPLDHSRVSSIFFREMSTRFVENDSFCPELLNGYFYYSRRLHSKSNFSSICRWKARLATEADQIPSEEGFASRKFVISCGNQQLEQREHHTDMAEEASENSKNVAAFVSCHSKFQIDEESREEVLIDFDLEGEGHGYIGVQSFKVSPNGRYFAFAIDLKGDERHQIMVRDLSKPLGVSVESQYYVPQWSPTPAVIRVGEKMELDSIPSAFDLEWASDSRGFFYTVQDELKRPSKVFFHHLSQGDGSPGSDELIYEETDDAFFVGISNSKDGKYLFIASKSKTTSEIHMIPSMSEINFLHSLQLVRPRSTGIEYFIDHAHNRFYMITNIDGAFNYKLLVCDDRALFSSSRSEAMSESDGWEEIIPHNTDIKINDIDLFQEAIVAYVTNLGLPEVLIYQWRNERLNREPLIIQMPLKICHIEAAANRDFFAPCLRFSFSSPIHPENLFEYQFDTGELRRMAERKIDGHNPEHYQCWREFVDSHENQLRIPMTMISRRGYDFPTDLKGESMVPVLLTAYGAYGQLLETKFRDKFLSLLDRGWVIALAHVRGGAELGKMWHLHGKLLNKSNSYKDFLSCAEFLQSNSSWLARTQQPTVDSSGSQAVSAEKLQQLGKVRRMICAHASSAGGLAVAQAINQNPGLFKACVLKVPFVDCLNSMLDDSLPLTVHEYDEWGNPNVDRQIFKAMASYDPYYNVPLEPANKFPSMMVTASTIDIRVPYWGPAKYVSRLRLRSCIDNEDQPLLFLVEDDSGHFGSGGNFGSLFDIAEEYSFLMASVYKN